MSQSTCEDNIKRSLCRFHTECQDLLYQHCTVPTIEVDIEDPKWCLTFCREFMAKNLPVVIKGGCGHFGAVAKWNATYFLNKFPKKTVNVSITPNGLADGLTKRTNPTTNEIEDIFALPEERTMSMREFLDHLQSPKENMVCYIQQQNSNLTENFPELLLDIDAEIKWASEVFDKKPDAVNFWMGDSRAITSMHKDFYENIYCVIDGYKDFILVPPSDLPKLEYRKYKVGRFKNVKVENFEIETCDEAGEISWISADPLNDNFRKTSCAFVHEVRVNKGDCLYLPSLWFHHVRQSHGCVAVNYWYDMDFDVKYCYYKLLEDLH